MILYAQRETLLKPLQLVIGVVERKQTLPILSNVLLDIKDNKISFTGTDLEVQLVGRECLMQDNIAEQRFTVPGRKLMDICRALPENAPVELFQEKDRIILKSNRSRFTLSTLSPEDFPNIEEHPSNCQFSISQKDLRFLFQRTYFSMAQQDVRYYLNGLLLEVNDGSLRSVATDGHRLATQVIDTPTQQQHRQQIIVPRKGIIELLRLLDDTDDVIDITISSNYIRVSNNQFVFTSKLIEGRFPDYDRVIPKNADKTVILDREMLKSALSRAAILCNEKFHGVRLEFRPNLLRIIANNPEQEAAEEELNIHYQSEDIDIGFNVNYLLDILNVLQSDTIALTFLDGNSSLKVEEQENSDNSTYVVMPMRL